MEKLLINSLFIIGAFCGTYAILGTIADYSFLDNIVLSILIVATIINIKSIQL